MHVDNFSVSGNVTIVTGNSATVHVAKSRNEKMYPKKKKKKSPCRIKERIHEIIEYIINF